MWYSDSAITHRNFFQNKYLATSINTEIATGLHKDLTCFEHTKEAITHKCGVKNNFSLMIKIARTPYANSCNAWNTTCKKLRNVCIYIHKYVCIYVYVFICIYMCLCMCIYTEKHNIYIFVSNQELHFQYSSNDNFIWKRVKVKVKIFTFQTANRTFFWSVYRK